MYKCEDCGAIFEETAIRRFVHHECDGHPYDELPVCPKCESGWFFEAEVCTSCNEYFNTLEGSEHICAACQKKTCEKFEDLLDKNFTKDEINYLNLHYDGEYFGEGTDGTKT